MSVEESHRRILKPEDLTGVVDTSQVVPTQEEKDDVDRFIESGKFRIKNGKVFLHDPEMARFSLKDTYEINLNGGFFVFEPTTNTFSPAIPTPLNLGPLAYLRQLSGWSPQLANLK